MKKIMFCSMIWGLILVLIGTSILINVLFGINIPIIKFLLAAFFIYMGIKILMPSSFKKWCKKYSYECTYKSESESFKEDKFNACFTSTSLDLNSFNALTEPKTIYISAQFAEVKVTLPNNIPVHVKADATFSAVNLPNGKNNVEYINLHGASEPILTVLINATFSNVSVK